jgi:hypothetical protein
MIRNDLIAEASAYATPHDVVRAATLSYVEKRDVLRRWALDTYLTEVAPSDAAPSPSRLPEIIDAIIDLDDPELRRLLDRTSKCEKPVHWRHSGQRTEEPKRADAAAVGLRLRRSYEAGHHPKFRVLVNDTDDTPARSSRAGGPQRRAVTCRRAEKDSRKRQPISKGACLLTATSNF